MDLLDPERGDDIRVPAQYSRLVSAVLNTKLDIDFGYDIKPSETAHNILLGSRAYQRAINHIKGEENRRIREDIEQQKLSQGS